MDFSVVGTEAREILQADLELLLYGHPILSDIQECLVCQL